MWISDNWKDYEVLDTSDGEKLERWGKYLLVRPDPQVIWSTPKTHPGWKRYDARYERSASGGGHWTEHKLPEHWQIRYGAPSVVELIESAARAEELRALGFLAACAGLCRAGTPFPEAWEQALRDPKQTGGLNDRDVSLLRAFGRGLGRSDARGQLEHGALYGERLSAALRSAQQDRMQRGRLCVRLGMLGGAAAVLILW